MANKKRSKPSSGRNKNDKPATSSAPYGSKPRSSKKKGGTQTNNTEMSMKGGGKRNKRVVGSYDRDKPVTEEQRTNYTNFLRETYSTGVQGIIQQYNNELKSYVPPNLSRTIFDRNPEKNRYKDVVCLDQTRVVLTDGHQNGDYVHANFVNGDPLVNTFICTQGPMPNSIIDFWRIVVQEKVENIFMLCETVEQGKPKCEQYWPREKDGLLEFSGIQIRNMEVDTSDSTTIVCVLEVIAKSDKFVVKHHQWRTWPDRSVPQSVMAPFRLLKVARWGSGPTIVHCSAGIGRTGTVVVLEVALQTVLTNKPLNVVQVVQQLRTMRMHAVQTDLQLLYINKCLIAYATAAGLIQGDLIEKSAKFDVEYNEMVKQKSQAGEQNGGYTPLTPVFGFGGTPPASTPTSPNPPANSPTPSAAQPQY